MSHAHSNNSAAPSVGAPSEQQAQRERCALAPGSAIPVPPYRWVPVADVLAIITDPRWSWVRNNACKYVELRIDTRNKHCLIFDRDRREITLKDLSRQLDEYLSPNHPQSATRGGQCLDQSQRPSPRVGCDALVSLFLMTTKELTQWLRDNSSGVYRPAAEAADLIEQLAESKRRDDILTAAMAEIYATIQGRSEQPIEKIVNGCRDELCNG